MSAIQVKRLSKGIISADMETTSPKIAIFSCRFGWGYCKTPKLPDHVTVACCGSIEAERLMEAFRDGHDGVLILACRRGECHFQDGEWQCLKSVELLRSLLAAHGIAPERLSVRFGNDPAGEVMAAMVAEFARELKAL